MEQFLPKKGNYRNLIVYQKAECIYDITFYFAHRHLTQGDRTIDQMIQAARSGKQNIAEGCATASTSSETELKLLNVARASLQELLTDFEDYLRVRGLTQWPTDDPRSVATRRIGGERTDSAFYRDAITRRSDETVANIAITLLHQEDYLLGRLLARLQDDFIKQGGIKEQMYRARVDYRARHPHPGDDK